MSDLLEKYKDIFLAILVTTVVVGVGTAGYLTYSGLKTTINNQKTDIIVRDANITDLTSRLIIEKGNSATLSDKIDAQNEQIKNQEVNISAQQAAYDKLKAMTPEERYGKTDTRTIILKDPASIGLTDMLDKISRMKYEDL